MSASDDPPIVALATAPGRGAVGIVRVSGRDLAGFGRQLLGATLVPRQATYLPFPDADGETIDQGLAIWFPAPHSYTGEDVLELQAHGGPVVLQILLERVLAEGNARGMRVAAPGEFTQRAFLNGKLDLAQAEAVADLIDAQSTQAARLAARSLVGVFSTRIADLLARLTHLRMLVEATLDFPEEEVDVLAREDVLGQWRSLVAALDDALIEATRGARLREGFTVVIAGRPNVGKSSLLNQLAGDDIAIVTPVAGTTRDRLRETILIDGIALNIIDTAGLRATDDPVERLGVEIARREIGQADLVLLIEAPGETHDATARDPVADGREIALQADVPILLVRNKSDLTGLVPGCDGEGNINISALTGQGLDALRTQLLASMGWQPGAEAQFLARERHLDALRRAAGHLAAAEPAMALGLELFAEELRLAQLAVGEITGAFSADDLLGEIFSAFCIGK